MSIILYFSLKMYLVLGLLASLLISVQAQVADDYNCTYVTTVAPAGVSFLVIEIKSDNKFHDR